MAVMAEKSRVTIIDGKSTLWIEPWGRDSLRIRMTKEAHMDPNDWALTEEVEACELEILED